MELKADKRDIRYALAAAICCSAVLYLPAARYALNELSYLLWSQTVEATITRTSEHKEHFRFASLKVRLIDYRFIDSSGTVRMGTAPVDTSDLMTAAIGENINVRYCACIGSSRLIGNKWIDWVRDVVLMAFAYGCAFCTYRAWRWAKAPKVAI